MQGEKGGGMQVPVWARKIKKSDIILKKNDKSNWGRFLDNHFNPSIHNKPFGVSMKTPNTYYKYSQSGLSHNYKTGKILEKLTVEEQNKREIQQRKFKEIEMVEKDDIFVFIEYWSNSEKTQISTRHIEEKYESFAKRFRQGILEKFPFIKVYLKSHSENDKITKYVIRDGVDANIIENQRETVRIGAFEISLARRVGSMPKVEVLFSKIKSRKWPSMPIILEKISKFLPSTSLMISFFDSTDNENNALRDAQNLKIKIKLSFKEWEANVQLRNDIMSIHSVRINDTLKNREELEKSRQSQNVRRYGRIASSYMISNTDKMSTRSVQRPMSAQTQFSASFHKTLVTMVKTNNEYRQQNGVRALRSVSGGTLRPRTAATNQLSTHFSKSHSLSTLQTSSKKKKKLYRVTDIEHTGEINEDGNVVFKDIPKAVYTITVCENAFFQKIERTANLFEEAVQNGTTMIYMGLERQLTSCTSIHFPKSKENWASFDSEDEDNLYFDDLEVKAILLHKLNKHQDDAELSDDGDDTDYEEEFYFDKKEQCYRCGLIPGRYMIIAKGDSLKEHSEILDVQEGNVFAEIKMKKPTKKQVFIRAYDASTGDSLGSVILRWKKKASRHVLEGLTTKEGLYCYVSDENATYIIEAEKKGYINYRREVVLTKGNEHIPDVRVPMMPVELPQKLANSDNQKVPRARYRVVISADYRELAENFDLNILGTGEHKKGTEQEINVHFENNVYNDDEESIQILTAKSNNYGNYAEIEANKDAWFKLFWKAEVISDFDYEVLDKHLTSPFQDYNPWMQIYSDNRLVKTVYPPTFSHKSYVWDLGFFNPFTHKFFETNCLRESDKHIGDDQKYLFKLYKYLNEQNEYYNFSLIFGFNEGVFQFDDYNIPEKQFIDRLYQLDVKWISEKVTEDQLNQKQEALHNAVWHLADGCKNLFGEISLKRVVERLEPHLGSSKTLQSLKSKNVRMTKLGPTAKLSMSSKK